MLCFNFTSDKKNNLKLMDLFSILYISPYEMAKIFKTGTETEEWMHLLPTLCTSPYRHGQGL